MYWNRCEIRFTFWHHIEQQSSSLWGWFNTPWYHPLTWYIMILKRSQECSVGFKPRPFECPQILVARHPKTASTFLGGWLGLKTWIQVSQEAIQAWSGRAWARLDPLLCVTRQATHERRNETPFAPDVLITFHPHPTIIGYISLVSRSSTCLNPQLSAQPWDCSTDGGAGWVEGSRQVIPAGVGCEKLSTSLQRVVC